jgi:hypothetical protein
MHGITCEHYSIDDVLPFLNLRTAVEVGVDIEETGFKLFIGPREYEWPRGRPDVCSVRTGSTVLSRVLNVRIFSLPETVTWNRLVL